MNKEVELKVVVKNPETVMAFLQENAERLGRKQQRDVYLITPIENFFADRPVYRYLRVRFNQEGGSFDYHVDHFGKEGELLWADEHETSVGSPETLLRICEMIGLQPHVTVEKDRTAFRYAGHQITFDDIRGVGSFLEVEAETAEVSSQEESDRTKQGIAAVLKKIGADWEKAPNMGYPDMVLAKQAENGIIEKN